MNPLRRPALGARRSGRSTWGANVIPLEDPNGAVEKLNRGIEFFESGDLESAAKLFLEVGDAGLPQGYCELAALAHSEGKTEEAHKWVQRMEALAAEDNDGNAHLSCYFAYEFCAANCAAEEQTVRARDHLQQAAELGNSQAQFILAGCYRQGIGDFPRDTNLYAH